MFNEIIRELKHHAPFTTLGALSGILVMIFFRQIPSEVSNNVFYTLHPIHVVLSAFATASMYNLHKCGPFRGKCKLLVILIIGYVGSVGIATLSDSIIPYMGEILLDLPNREIHLGFIEKWWLINPLAIIGVIFAYFKPKTKFPHMGHVLLSTWASLFHIIMSLGAIVLWFQYLYIFIFLFLAVWLPCCVSDIVFPLLFAQKTHNEKQH
jgi:hypothetical protein